MVIFIAEEEIKQLGKLFLFRYYVSKQNMQHVLRDQFYNERIDHFLAI